MARAIFISYRRDDSEGETGRLFDDLVRSFGDDSVFMDVAGIDPGIDFRTAIDSNVAGCGVCIAVIGPRWATMPSPSGKPRLDDPNDFVRLEISSALRRNIAVIPVLVHDAKMPHPEELPDDLKDLAYRNSVEITHARWNSDVQLLTSALAQYVNATRANANKPVHATVSVQLPAPHDARPSVAASGSSRSMYAWIGGAVLLLALLIIGGLALAGHGAHTRTDAAATPDSTAAMAAAGTDLLAQIVGTWSDSAIHAGKNLFRVTVSSSAPNTFSVHAWGYCPPATCDWGTQPAVVSGSSLVSHWPDHHSATMTLTVVNGTLDVVMLDIYANGATRRFDHRYTRE